jgi:hypothetical protein
MRGIRIKPVYSVKYFLKLKKDFNRRKRHYREEDWAMNSFGSLGELFNSFFFMSPETEQGIKVGFPRTKKSHFEFTDQLNINYASPLFLAMSFVASGKHIFTII